MLASGFTRADVEYRSPIPREHRLVTVAVPDNAEPAFAARVDVFNENVEKLNRRMLTYLDYAVVAPR